MAEADSSSSSSSSRLGMLRSYYQGWKESWAERFDFLDDVWKLVDLKQKSNQRFSESDIQEFIASDPIHGPTLKHAREMAKVCVKGSIFGAVATAGVAWKYSRSPHGAVLAAVYGSYCGWMFTQESMSHWYQLYREDPRASEIKFYEWWVNKIEGRQA